LLSSPPETGISKSPGTLEASATEDATGWVSRTAFSPEYTKQFYMA
jgi:hypothetical protein